MMDMNFHYGRLFRSIVTTCIILHNMIIEDKRENSIQLLKLEEKFYSFYKNEQVLSQ